MRPAFAPNLPAAGSADPWLPLQLSDARLRPLWEEWPDCVRLGFAATRIHPQYPTLQALHIAGVRPERLQTLRIRDDQGTVFELESLADAVGRRVSAGEFLQAICAQTAPGHLTVDSMEFLRALPITRALVELQVRITDGWEAQSIRVHGQVA